MAIKKKNRSEKDDDVVSLSASSAKKAEEDMISISSTAQKGIDFESYDSLATEWTFAEDNHSQDDDVFQIEEGASSYRGGKNLIKLDDQAYFLDTGKQAAKRDPNLPDIKLVQQPKRSLISWLLGQSPKELDLGQKVLIAKIEGDTGIYQKYLYSILSSVAGLCVKTLPSGIVDPDPVRSSIQALSWVKEQKAELIVWGSLDVASRMMCLYFITPKDEFSTLDIAYKARKIYLPLSLKTDYQALFKATALASMIPETPENFYIMRRNLPALIEESKSVGISPAPGLGAEEQAANMISYASILSMQSYTGGTDSTFEETAELYKKVIDVIPAQKKDEKAIILRNMGFISQIKGEKNKNKSDLLKAVSYFKDSLNENPFVSPFEKAFLYQRIGNIHKKIALSGGEAKNFEEAIDAYQEALQNQTKASNPERWASILNNLGQVMQVYGEETRNVKMLEATVRLYKHAEEVQTKDLVPVSYATTRNNLASTYFLLAKYKKDPKLLDESVEILKEAFEIFNLSGVSHMRDVVLRNLKRTEEAVEAVSPIRKKEKDLAWAEALMG